MIENADDYRRLRSAFEPSEPNVGPLVLAIIGGLAMLFFVVFGIVWNAASLPILDEPIPTSQTRIP